MEGNQIKHKKSTRNMVLQEKSSKNTVQKKRPSSFIVVVFFFLIKKKRAQYINVLAVSWPWGSSICIGQVEIEQCQILSKMSNLKRSFHFFFVHWLRFNQSEKKACIYSCQIQQLLPLHVPHPSFPPNNFSATSNLCQHYYYVPSFPSRFHSFVHSFKSFIGLLVLLLFSFLSVLPREDSSLLHISADFHAFLFLFCFFVFLFFGIQ